MPTIRETSALLEKSLRVRRNLLGKPHPNASREILTRFVTAAKSKHNDVLEKSAPLVFAGDISDGELTGSAGELLSKIIRAMGLPPGDIPVITIPSPPDETTALRRTQGIPPNLRDRIARLRPQVLVALGEAAMRRLAGIDKPIAAMRGNWLSSEGIPLLPTFHPTHLLRNSDATEKRKVWEDMLLVMEKLNLPISGKQRGYFRTNA